MGDPQFPQTFATQEIKEQLGRVACEYIAKHTIPSRPGAAGSSAAPVFMPGDPGVFN